MQNHFFQKKKKRGKELFVHAIVRADYSTHVIQPYYL